MAARLQALSLRYPDVSYTLIDDGVRATRGSYLSAMHSLIEGAVLATIVVLLFLRNWRATMLSAVALPLSVIPAFAAMELMGFSLNFVSLLAITLVTGILVDDAIVEIENIVRHMNMGKRPYEAAIEAADEIGLRGGGDQLHHRGGVRAGSASWAALPGSISKQFGLTGGGRGDRVVAGRAADHPAYGGLPAETGARACGAGRLDHAGLHALPTRDSALAAADGPGGAARVRTFAVVHDVAADRLHPARGRKHGSRYPSSCRPAPRLPTRGRRRTGSLRTSAAYLK